MVDDVLILHHVQLVHFFESSLIKFFLGDAAYDIFFDPLSSMVRWDLVIVLLNSFDGTFTENHLQFDGAANSDDTLSIGVVLGRLRNRQVDEIGDPVGQQFHVSAFELGAHVLADSGASGPDHKQEHGNDEAGVHHDLDEEEFERAALELFELLPRALVAKESFALALCRGAWLGIGQNFVNRKVSDKDDSDPLVRLQ